MMTRTRSFAGLAVIAGLTLLAGCNNNSSVANVAGDTVTRDEFMEQLQTKRTVRVNVNGRVAEVPVADTLAFQAMQELVTRKIIMQLAKDEGVAPTEKEVDDEIAFRTKLDGTFIKNLQAIGFTLQGIRQNIMSELAQEKIITKGITVTEADVDQYMKDNPKQFIEPAKANLTFIFAKSEEKKAAAQKALDSGMLFKMAARQFSEAPNAAENEGRFAIQGATNATGDTDLSKLSPEIRGPIESTETGKATDWIKAGTSYVKFFVNSKTSAKPIEMTKEKKELLRRRLAIQRGSAASDLTRRVADKLKAAKIEVSDPSLKDMWAKFEERLKESAKDTKLPATTTGGSGETPLPTTGSTTGTTTGNTTGTPTPPNTSGSGGPQPTTTGG